MIRTILRLFVMTLIVTAASSAQMGGGMMGGSLGGMMGGSLSGMMGGGSGLTIGPDGTLYLVRSAAAPSSQTVTTQLAAIDPGGNVKWTLPINSGTASQPALGSDGTLFVTTSDWLNWMFNWMYNGIYSVSPAADPDAANLVVVRPGAASATVIATVPLAGHVASAPQIATDNAGGYVVYVVTADAMNGNGLNNSPNSGSYLYAFSPTGALKYRLQLSQSGMGMMSF